MSPEHDTSKLQQHLQSLESALQDREAKEALALLRVVRMNGLKDQTSANLVAAFSDGPQESDYQRCQQWTAQQLQSLAPQLDELGLFDDFDDFDPFEDANFLSDADDISELDESDAFDSFMSIESDSDVLLSDENEDESADDISLDELDSDASVDSFHPSEEMELERFFAAEETSDSQDAPATRESTRQFNMTELQALSEASGASEAPSAPWNSAGGSRQKTQQFNPAELQALSEASSEAEQEEEEIISDEIEVDFALGSSISTPIEQFDSDSEPFEDDEDLDVHQKPTKSAFRLPAPKSLSRKEPLTSDAESEKSDDFNFDFEAETTHEAPDSADNFDFGPDSTPQDQNEAEEDEFSFDLGLDAPSSDHSTASEADDDFDLGFGFGASSKSELLQQGDPFGTDMGYAEPSEEDSFFPPPLNANQTPEPVDHGSAPHNVPEPDPDPGRSERPTNRVNSLPSRQRQQTPIAQVSDFTNQQAEKTPTRGPEPISEDASSLNPASTSSGLSALNEEEFFAIGVELSQASESSTTYEDEDQDEGAHRYRGEPLIRELGDEATPSHEEVSSTNADPFAGTESGNEATNPFAQDIPTGTGKKSLGSIDASSFYLEEVDRPKSQNSAALAVAETLDRARALYEMASFEEALELVDAVLDVDEDSQAGEDLRSLLTGELERIQKNRLGSLSGTPELSVSMNDIATLDLDNRAGFLISQIDGMLTFEDILDMSAMNRLETLTLLVELYESDVIKIG